MTAWTRLLAVSSLAVGTAWQLLTSPKTGGAGVVLNDGYTVEVANDPLTAELAASAVTAELDAKTYTSELAFSAVDAEVRGALAVDLLPTVIEVALASPTLQLELLNG